MNNYHMFISYRREGGGVLAGRLADRLSALGYRVFYDLNSMHYGTFDTQIMNALAACSVVLIVLSPNALDRCVNPDDWVRQELVFALKHNKKIIPILMDGFDFPDTLPADIDIVRHMAGITHSCEHFDSVIEKIQRFLKSALPIDSLSKYPAIEDPVYSEQTIQDILLYYSLHLPIPDAAKSRVDESLMKYSDLQNSHGKYTGVAGRRVLHTVPCRGKWYNLYDVFYRDEKKYAYGLEANVSPADQQIGVFFSIDDNDTVTPLISGTPNASFPDVETATLFTWYTIYRRGFGTVPDIFWSLRERQLRSFSVESVNTYADHLGIIAKTESDMSNVVSDQGEILQYLRAINTNLLYPRISGTYNNIGVFFRDGNCYGNRFQGFFAGGIIRTPIRNKVILDIVPTLVEKHYIALVYNKAKKKRVDYLLEGPEYYLITKRENDDLSICRITEDNIEFWCKDYFERFALIYMQVKLQLINAFLNNQISQK